MFRVKYFSARIAKFYWENCIGRDACAFQILYANRHSNVSLEKLKIRVHHLFYQNFDSAEFSFVNVAELDISECMVSKERFKWLFPKVQTISHTSASDFSSLGQHFPELRSLVLSSCFGSKISIEQAANLTGCFRCNPQLRELKYQGPSKMATDVMRSAAELLASLSRISIEPIGKVMKLWRSAKPVHFKNGTTFALVYYGLGMNTLNFLG